MRASYKRGDLAKVNIVVKPFKTKRKQLLIGSKFGQLEIIQALGLNCFDSGVYECKCDCGTVCLASRQQLVTLNKQSCGCLNYKHLDNIRHDLTGKKWIIKEPKEKFLTQLFYRYQQNAKKRKLEFNIPLEIFEKLIEQNCIYCGLPPSNRAHRAHYYDFNYSGLDRIDNNIGYLQDNVIPCCKNCNYFKGELTQEEFINQIKRIYDHQKNK